MSYELESIWQAMKGTHYRRILEDLKTGIMDAQDLLEALTVALDRVVSAAHAEAGTFWFHDRFGDGLIRPLAAFGGSNLEGITLKPGEGIAGEVIKTGVANIISDCQKDPRWERKVDASTGFRTLSMICVPLNWHQYTFGSIQIINKTDGITYDEKDLIFVQGLAVQVAITFEQRGLLSDYVTAEQIQSQSSSREQQEIGITALMTKSDFAELEAEIQKMPAFRGMNELTRKNVLRHMREIWLIYHKNGIVPNQKRMKRPS